MIGINANIFKIVSFVISVHPYIDNFLKYLHPLRRYLRLLSLKKFNCYKIIVKIKQKQKIYYYLIRVHFDRFNTCK